MNVSAGLASRQDGPAPSRPVARRRGRSYRRRTNKIIHGLQIHAPASDVFAALSTAEGLAGWWSEEVRTEGDTHHFTFLEGFNPRMKVTMSREPDRVAWRCVGGHDNWRDNTFTFDLTSAEGETRLLFTQFYAEELDDATYGEYNFNWGCYLHSLKQYCETGSGTPFSPD